MSYNGKIIPIYGDTHAYFDDLHGLADGLPAGIHVGDFGWGFREIDPEIRADFLKWGLRAIRGNHDNPAIAKADELYLGDYGVTEDGIFYVSGAKTPDFDIHRRMMEAELDRRDPSWWPEEQLTYEELQEASVLYEETKPDIVVTHDAPGCLTKALIAAAMTLNPGGPSEPEYNVTTRAFDHFLNLHRPKYWYFGHWHFNWAFRYRGCWFRCVASNDFCIAGTIDDRV